MLDQVEHDVANQPLIVVYILITIARTYIKNRFNYISLEDSVLLELWKVGQHFVDQAFQVFFDCLLNISIEIK
jgi:S-adenosylmethionine synthetase